MEIVNHMLHVMIDICSRIMTGKLVFISIKNRVVLLLMLFSITRCIILFPIIIRFLHYVISRFIELLC